MPFFDSFTVTPIRVSSLESADDQTHLEIGMGIFLCETAEANTEYTRRQLTQDSDTSYDTIDNHLDEYIESGIIDVVDAAGNDRVDSYYLKPLTVESVQIRWNTIKKSSRMS